MSTLDIAPLPLNALLIPTASNALLAIWKNPDPEEAL